MKNISASCASAPLTQHSELITPDRQKSETWNAQANGVAHRKVGRFFSKGCGHFHSAHFHNYASSQSAHWHVTNLEFPLLNHIFSPDKLPQLYSRTPLFSCLFQLSIQYVVRTPHHKYSKFPFLFNFQHTW